MGSQDVGKQGPLESLEIRIHTILPEEYQDCYDDVKPVSMGSAPLKYAEDGKVAWGDMWQTFCDLAMAGGPPHRGALLEPACKDEIAAQPIQYRDAVDEICRGVGLVTGLHAEISPATGWVRVECNTSSMAEWLVRAITMENISARNYDAILELPAGPGFRVQKEIKNVITSVAKTCHYWCDHMTPFQQHVIGNMFTVMSMSSPLILPSQEGDESTSELKTLRKSIADGIEAATGLRSSEHTYPNWLGVTCPDVHSAIWMMRALVVTNVLARREGTILFVPVNPASDPTGQRVVRFVRQIHGFAKIRNVL